MSDNDLRFPKSVIASWRALNRPGGVARWASQNMPYMALRVVSIKKGLDRVKRRLKVSPIKKGTYLDLLFSRRKKIYGDEGHQVFILVR